MADVCGGMSFDGLLSLSSSSHSFISCFLFCFNVSVKFVVLKTRPPTDIRANFNVSGGSIILLSLSGSRFGFLK